MLENTSLRVAIYIRVSTIDQVREGYSLESQEKTLRKWCSDRNMEIYDLYADRGISGKDIDHRPDMNRLLRDAQDKKFDMVLFWALSRFTRSVADLYNTLEKFQRWGVSMISYTESFDTSTPMGRAMIGVVGVFAQLERELTGERVVAAMLERASQGKRTCHDVLGYDLDGKHSLKINPEEASYVNFVHEQYLIRKSMLEVAHLARETGYRGKRGGEPEAESIHKILTRPVYAGYNMFQGNLYKGIHDPIRSVSQYNKVQRLIVKQGRMNGQTRKNPLYILPETEGGPIKLIGT